MVMETLSPAWARVSGMNAVIYGNNNIVSGMNATVHGDNNLVSGMNCSAFGQNNSVTGMNSVSHPTMVNREVIVVNARGGTRRQVHADEVNARHGGEVNARRGGMMMQQPQSVQVTLRGSDEREDDDAQACRVCLCNKKVVMSTCCSALSTCIQCARTLYMNKNVGDVKCILCNANVTHVFRVS